MHTIETPFSLMNPIANNHIQVIQNWITNNYVQFSHTPTTNKI